MNALKNHEIPGRVTVFPGKGGLPAIQVETDRSFAEIYPHGAHVTRFQKKGGEPLLFMSGSSEFAPGKPIRGGVPLIFPWFGDREGYPAHGTARRADWDLLESLALPDGSIRLTFRLPDTGDTTVDFVVTVGASLVMEFSVTHHGDADFTFENCLHSYFQVGSVSRIAVTGLTGARVVDSLTGSEGVETAETLRFAAETDRIYQNTESTVEIHDPELCRTIRIAKSGSLSTVVWNPWIEKSRRMPDFGDDEYPHMVCVESGNLKENSITLAPGGKSVLRVEIDSVPLD